MNTFEHPIRLGNQTLTLHFHPIVSPSGIKYSVVVTAEQKQLDSFEMKESSGRWRPIAPCPAWAHANGESLSDIIRSQEFGRL